MSIGRQAIFAVLWNSLGNYAGFGVNFISQLILVRLLVPEDFGVFALLLSIFEVISFLTAWSFSIAVIQMPESDELFDTAFWLSLLEAIIFFFVVILLSNGLVFLFPKVASFKSLFIVLGLSRAFTLITAQYIAILEKSLNYKIISLTRSIVSVISSVLAIVLALLGLGVWSLVSKDILFSVLSVFAFGIMSGWRFGWRFNRESAKKILSFSSKILVSRSFEAAFYKIDSLVLGLLCGVNALGYYSQARYLVEVSSAVITPASTVAAVPIYAKIQGDENKLKATYSLYHYFLIRLMIPIVLIFILFPQEVVMLLFGEKWKASAMPLFWLALYPLLVSVFENLKSLLYGTGFIGRAAKVRIVQLIFSIVILILLTKLMSVQGTSIGYILSVIFGLVLICFFIPKYIIEAMRKNLLVPIFSAILAASLIFLLKILLHNYLGLYPMIGLVIFSIVLYSMSLFLFERQLLKANLSKIVDKVLMK